MASPKLLAMKATRLVVRRDVGALAEMGQNFDVRRQMVELAARLALGASGNARTSRAHKYFIWGIVA